MKHPFIPVPQPCSTAGSLLRTAALFAIGASTLAAVARLRHRISFAGKVVLITGGSRGLGLALARELADEGARLVLLARDPAELARAEADLKKHDTEVLVIPCDVRDPDAAAAAVEKTIEWFGVLDVVINNAGIIIVGPLETMTHADYHDALALHFWAPLYMMQAALPHLKRRQGRIVNISSIGGKIAVPHLAPYVASKFALTGLSDAFRAELAKDGVRVTTVCPGLMRTGSHINAQFKGRQSEEFAWFALGAASPVSSIAARRAAQQIIHACRYGRPQIVLTLQARLAVLAGALFPNLTAEAISLANALLPSARDGESEARPGGEVRGAFPPRSLTKLADDASEDFNEH